VGRDAGVPVEKLEALADPQASAALSELEQRVVAFAEGMSRTPVDVPDELVAALRRELGDAGIVELANSIAWENFRARFNRAFSIESDQLSEGAFCVAPLRPTG
jgi:alkylhydroperoxidase family enzyme